MKSHTFDLNDVQIMSSDEALLINGGTVNNDLLNYYVSKVKESIAESWSNICTGFNAGYKEHRK